MNHSLVIDGTTGQQTFIELTDEELAALRPTDEEIKKEQIARFIELRRGAYATEADPLYFGWQRGENTEQAWLDKVAEIRARYPYPA